MDLGQIFSSNYSSTFNVDNIYLKLVSTTDYDFIVKLLSCADVKEFYILSKVYQNNLMSFTKFLISKFKAGQGFDFIIFDLHHKPVGLIGCEFERINNNLVGNVSYAIHSDYRNKGYATEALQFMCRITDESQLSYLKLDINAENIISERIAERLGFEANKQIALFDEDRPNIGLRFAWYRECNQILPKRVELSLNAINCFRERNYYEAINLFREALKYENPIGSPHSDAQIFSNLGMALSTTKQYKEAFNCLMKAYNSGLRNDSVLREIQWLKTNASNHIY